MKNNKEIRNLVSQVCRGEIEVKNVIKIDDRKKLYADIFVSRIPYMFYTCFHQTKNMLTRRKITAERKY